MGDSTMIQSYKNCEMYHYVELLLISMDGNFIEMAHGRECQGFPSNNHKQFPSK